MAIQDIMQRVVKKNFAKLIKNGFEMWVSDIKDKSQMEDYVAEYLTESLACDVCRGFLEKQSKIDVLNKLKESLSDCPTAICKIDELMSEVGKNEWE